jgi:hypothetical protein
MASLPISEVLVGVYLGLLAGIFPSFVAFAIGFGFKYFTTVTVPGTAVIVLGGTLAGVSGGLMGIISPEVVGSWTGITAVVVILMSCLWSHSQGDKLAAATPRRLTLKSLRESRLSLDLVERVDSYGHLRIRPVGEIHNIEGYPPLPDDVRQKIRAGSWRFPADLPISDLEARLEERLTTDYDLAEASATIDRRGLAQVAAAPSAAGLSRRVPPGKRAVSIQTLLPTGLARGDTVTIRLPDGDATGPVVSAHTAGVESVAVESVPAEDDGAAEAGPDGAGPDETVPERRAPTATGGEGQVTVALSYEEARRVIRAGFAPIVVHSRGKQREYEAIGLLKQHGNQFRKVTVGAASSLLGGTIGAAQIRDTYGVAILSVRRQAEQIVAPTGATELRPGDELIVVGRRDGLDAFRGVAA